MMLKIEPLNGRWGHDVEERSGIIWLDHRASQFKLNTSTFLSLLFGLSNRLLYSMPNLISTSSELEAFVSLSASRSMSSVLGCLSVSLRVSGSLPLSVSLHHTLFLSVSDSCYLPISISLMKRWSTPPRGLWEGEGISIWAKAKRLPIGFCWYCWLFFLMLESCMLSWYLCSFFFF